MTEPSGATAAPSVRLRALRELWIHTGTTCNLSCPFCHEGSKPGDDRIAAPSYAEIAPHLDAAAAAGVQRFVLTGGEPLILRDAGRVLAHALQLAPVMVITNGTAPFIRRSHQLAALRNQAHAVAFRVSLDYADEARHDAQRGFGNFRKAVQGLKILHQAGFETSVARQLLPAETPDKAMAVARAFRAIFQRNGLPADLVVATLPELAPPGAQGHCLVNVVGGAAREPLCAGSRMLLRHSNEIRYFACALVDDDARFDLGPSLDAACATAVPRSHPRCAVCTYGTGYALVPDVDHGPLTGRTVTSR